LDGGNSKVSPSCYRLSFAVKGPKILPHHKMDCLDTDTVMPSSQLQNKAGTSYIL